MWSYRMITPTITRRRKRGVSGFVYLEANSGFSTALWHTKAIVAKQVVTFSWGMLWFCRMQREVIRKKKEKQKKTETGMANRRDKVGGGGGDGVQHGGGVGVEEGHFVCQLISHSQVVDPSSLQEKENNNNQTGSH